MLNALSRLHHREERRMRITRARVVSQVFFFGLFVFFLFVTQFGHLRGYPVSAFLEVNPLVAVATAITTHTVYQALIWSLVLLMPTLLLGRFFCGWICPLGSLQQFTGWVFNSRSDRQQARSNQYRKYFATKYYLLIGLLAAALFGLLQIGLLDPICLLYRSCTVAVLPLLDEVTGAIYVRPHVHRLAWLIGFVLFGLVAASLIVPRFFCRSLCPLGAALGILSRFSLWRIDRDEELCVHCDLCVTRCEGASDPHARLRKSECLVCLNCLDDCAHDALRFRFLPSVDGEVSYPDMDRRKALFAGLTGLLFVGFARRTGSLGRNFRKELVRPPGSVTEAGFLERCIKCDQCIRVCPTNVLQPAFMEGGIEGLWTPVLNMRLGYCELNCTLCGQVCPTGAIQKVSVAQKLGRGDFAAAGPIRIGTAFYDRGRCLPWAMDTPCVVCQEVCPVSPKAIYTRTVRITDRDGQQLTLQRPYVDPAKCIGCGICEHECPVTDHPAVRVTAVGETRTPDHSLLLTPGLSSADTRQRSPA